MKGNSFQNCQLHMVIEMLNLALFLFFLLQDLRDLWIHCSQCSRCHRSWVVGAVEWSKWYYHCSSRGTDSLVRDQKLLAGPSVSQLSAGLYGLCLCHLLALSLQCTLVKSDKTPFRQKWTSIKSPSIIYSGTLFLLYLLPILGRKNQNCIHVWFILVSEL